MNPNELKLGMSVWVLWPNEFPDGFISKILLHNVTIMTRQGIEIELDTDIIKIGVWNETNAL